MPSSSRNSHRNYCRWSKDSDGVCSRRNSTELEYSYNATNDYQHPLTYPCLQSCKISSRIAVWRKPAILEQTQPVFKMQFGRLKAFRKCTARLNLSISSVRVIITEVCDHLWKKRERKTLEVNEIQKAWYEFIEDSLNSILTVLFCGGLVFILNDW